MYVFTHNVVLMKNFNIVKIRKKNLNMLCKENLTNSICVLLYSISKIVYMIQNKPSISPSSLTSTFMKPALVLKPGMVIIFAANAYK